MRSVKESCDMVQCSSPWDRTVGDDHSVSPEPDWKTDPNMELWLVCNKQMLS